MNTTFNLELNNRPSKQQTYAILLRITQNKKHSRKKTTIQVKNKQDFNPRAKSGRWIRSSEPNHKMWNEILEKELEEAKNAYRDLKNSGIATKERIKSKITDAETSSSFLEYAKQRAQDINNEGGYRNYKKYNGFCNKLEDFLAKSKKKDVYFPEITTSFLSRFEAYLHSLANSRNPEARLHPNTISLTLRIFKTIINRAIQVDKIITPAANPFLGFKYPGPNYSVKEKLSELDLQKIEELELEKGSLIWHCKNYFLFSFYMAGIRAGDLIQLRWSNITSDRRLEYRMGKTNKDRSLSLHPKALDILKHYHKTERKPTDYIFPLLDNEAPYAVAFNYDQKATMPPKLIAKLKDAVSSKNALINKNLKLIAKKAGIEKNVSFHISRHSFAKIAKDRKVDSTHLKNILGHSNLNVTERYMGSFDTEETDEVMRSIFKEATDSFDMIKKQLQKMKPEELERLFSELKKDTIT
jgi:integrase